jgi:hypothetical protein
LAADLHDLAVADRLVESAAADPVARFQHHRCVTGALDLAGGGQAGEACAHDHDIGVKSLHAVIVAV